jgi:DNA-binding beta-propeller fold protein YncE
VRGLALLIAVSSLATFSETRASSPILKPRLVVSGFTEGSAFTQPRGIAFDRSDGAIVVANTGAHRIEVYSPSGRPLARFVHLALAANGSTTDGAPCALAFDHQGRLLVADLASTAVDVIDRRGRLVQRLSIPAGRPSALAVAADGTVFVGTTGDVSKIYRFSPDLVAEGSWGEDGEAPGQLTSVTALAVLENGTLAVACARTSLGIQLFSPAGAYLRGFANHELGRGSVSLPSGVFGTADGRIWVLDEIRQVIEIFDAEGTFIEQVGGRGEDAGLFAHPSSMTTNGSGLIAVTDRELGRFQVLQISEATTTAVRP